MACSCRTSALRIFVRSLTEVYAPNNTLARTPRHNTRPRVHLHTTRLGISYRQLHATARVHNAAQANTADQVSSEATEQQAPREDGGSTQQAEQSTAEVHVVQDTRSQTKPQLSEDEVLFELDRRSKNAKKKARKYGNLTASSLTTGEKQEVQEIGEKQEVQPIGENQEIQEVGEKQEVQEIQEKQVVRDIRQEQETPKEEAMVHTKITVDDKRESRTLPKRRPRTEERNKKTDHRPQQSGRELAPTEWSPKRSPHTEDRYQKRDDRYQRTDDRSQQFNRENAPTEWRKRDNRPMWAIQKEALKKKFPDGWQPRKRLSPDALAGIQALHQQFPEIYTTYALSEKFQMSPEAIRRILRAKWEPASEDEEDRQRRWFKRGLRIWERYAELGKKPPLKWQQAWIQQRPWNGRRGEEEEEGEEGEEDDNESGVDQEKLRRLKAQLKLAKSLM